MSKLFNILLLVVLSFFQNLNANIADFSIEKENARIIEFSVAFESATGMATETGKQYDLAVRRLEKRGGSYTIEKVLQEINWVEVLKQGVIQSAITGFSTYIVTHPKYGALVEKIKSRLKIQNLTSSSGINQLKKYFKKRLTNSVGSVKYPINNFIDFVNNTFTTAQKQMFDKANNFYKSFKPSFNVNELRGIDFDFPVTNIVKQEDNIMYQMATLDDAGNPRFGSYFFENINEDVTKLGIGGMNRITSDGRVKVKVVLESEVDFLKSKTANIEDWTGSGEIFQGGGNQYYNPTARNKIKSFEILD